MNMQLSRGLKTPNNIEQQQNENANVSINNSTNNTYSAKLETFLHNNDATLATQLQFSN